MSEEKHQHHLFHHMKEHENQNAPSGVVYSETTTTYGDEQVTQTADVYAAGNVDEYEKAKKEEKHHKHKEHLGELGTVAAGAFALLHEKHAEKKDPEHAQRHKIEEEIAATAAVGAGGFVFHEHHEKKESKKEEKEAEGKKHHHLF